MINFFILYISISLISIFATLICSDKDNNIRKAKTTFIVASLIPVMNILTLTLLLSIFCGAATIKTNEKNTIICPICNKKTNEEICCKKCEKKYSIKDEYDVELYLFEKEMREERERQLKEENSNNRKNEVEARKEAIRKAYKEDLY